MNTGPLQDLPADELLDLCIRAVRENERLLRACHAQRDRARRAEANLAALAGSAIELTSEGDLRLVMPIRFIEESK